MAEAMEKSIIMAAKGNFIEAQRIMDDMIDDILFNNLLGKQKML